MQYVEGVVVIKAGESSGNVGDVCFMLFIITITRLLMYTSDIDKLMSDSMLLLQHTFMSIYKHER